jgi:archaellum biogenesis protein FlaJ (TadC family)
MSDIQIYMRELGQGGEAGPLPDPALIWWKAQLLQRRAAQEKAVEPIRLAGKLAFVISAVAAIMMVIAWFNELSQAGLLPLIWMAVAAFALAAAVALAHGRRVNNPSAYSPR